MIVYTCFYTFIQMLKREELGQFEDDKKNKFVGMVNEVQKFILEPEVGQDRQKPADRKK